MSHPLPRSMRRQEFPTTSQAVLTHGPHQRHRCHASSHVTTTNLRDNSQSTKTSIRTALLYPPASHGKRIDQILPHGPFATLTAFPTRLEPGQKSSNHALTTTPALTLHPSATQVDCLQSVPSTTAQSSSRSNPPPKKIAELGLCEDREFEYGMSATPPASSQ